MSDERWLPVVGWEGFYDVSDLGKVRSVDRVVVSNNGVRKRLKGRVLLSRMDVDGRRMVTLSRPARREHVRVHRAVLMAFVGLPPEGMEGCHNNGIASDNRLINLRWDTHSENTLDRERHGTNHFRNRIRCPLNHLLEPPNLVAASLRKGYRVCLACARARARRQMAERAGRCFDFSVVVTLCYEQIMEGRDLRDVG